MEFVCIFVRSLEIELMKLTNINCSISLKCAYSCIIWDDVSLTVCNICEDTNVREICVL